MDTSNWFDGGEPLDPVEVMGRMTADEIWCCPLCGHPSTEDPMNVLAKKQERRNLLEQLGIDPDSDDSDIQLELLRRIARQLS